MFIKRTLLLEVMAICLFGPLALKVAAQEGQLDPSPPKGTTPEAIIQRFAAKAITVIVATMAAAIPPRE